MATHKHGFCSPALQIIIIVFGLIAASLAAYGIFYDYSWNEEFASILHAFNATTGERDLLPRHEYAYEATFVLIVGTSTFLMLIHVALSLKRRNTDDYYGTKWSKIFHLVVLVAHVVAFVLMVVSVQYYDANYSKVEAQDTRRWRYEFVSHGEDIELPSPHSIFYYCHLGHGRLARPAEMKGLRIRKTDSKICQHLGAKLLAALLALYIAILCYCVQWFILVSDRYLDGKALAMLFDLYGDAEEFVRDHPHHPNPETEVKALRQAEKFKQLRDEDEVKDAKFEEEYKMAVVETEDQDEEGDQEGENANAKKDGGHAEAGGSMDMDEPHPSMVRRAALRSDSKPKL